jgi:hypothetical protein
MPTTRKRPLRDADQGPTSRRRRATTAGNHGAAARVGSVVSVCGTCHAVFAQKFATSVHRSLRQGVRRVPQQPRGAEALRRDARGHRPRRLRAVP